MNRLDKFFNNKKENILSIYYTAGYPKLTDTATILKELQESGADLVEIGMPFSDPVADGPVIQESSKIALQNGMSVKVLFEQLENIRSEINIPIILMGYINPVMQYGIEKFCQKAQEIGIDGLIIPDLPFDLYMRDYKEMFTKYNLHNINLITPSTSDKRIKQIDDNSTSFIYVVSSASTTGTKQADNNVLKTMFDRLQNIKSPTLIGFGISDKNTFKNACNFANGAIIGSAFVSSLAKKQNIDNFIFELVKTDNLQFNDGVSFN